MVLRVALHVTNAPLQRWLATTLSKPDTNSTASTHGTHRPLHLLSEVCVLTVTVQTVGFLLLCRRWSVRYGAAVTLSSPSDSGEGDHCTAGLCCRGQQTIQQHPLRTQLPACHCQRHPRGADRSAFHSLMPVVIFMLSLLTISSAVVHCQRGNSHTLPAN